MHGIIIFLRWIVAAHILLLFSQAVWAADFRDPENKQFIVWPNIPVIRASDFEEYERDRKIFTDLHLLKADPGTITAALAAVDSLQNHHERRTLADLGRSLNAQLIGELDKFARNGNVKQPKLRFDFANISPQDLQRQLAMDTAELNKLKKKASQVTLVIYITYTRLEGNLLQLVCTVVKLANGESQSFVVTAPINFVGQYLALEIFNYFQGNRFPKHQDPMPDREWLAAGPGHTNQLVSHEMAKRYCKSQNAELPTATEIEMGESAGFYNGGVALKADSLYHIKTGMYYSSETQDVAGKIRPVSIENASLAYYYCIRNKAYAKK
ncbi:MAG: hypothetical protein IPH35_18015 [Rhodoferax sp.]|nr:hypothetical protein [Rhodoferax sp.]